MQRDDKRHVDQDVPNHYPDLLGSVLCRDKNHC